jgi:moderate conductance mechanosensitive channel
MENKLIQFFNDYWFATLLIIIGAFFARRLMMLFIERLIRRSMRSHRFKSEREEKLRADTLVEIMGAATGVGVWIVAAMLFLSEVGVQIAPLLAGAGVIGVALGFGAQSMVKDFLAGIFILSENQYRVGDVVQINGTTSGVVERFTLRQTVLRDLDGMVHHYPNGNIEFATNMTMEFANVNLDIGINYDTDLDHVEKVINQVGQKLAEDETWKEKIIVAPAFLRVNDFDESAIIIKITGKTVPMEQWAITGELRRRLKKAFDKESIEIPYKQVVIHKSASVKPHN